jgi:hypothetical protein
MDNGACHAIDRDRVAGRFLLTGSANLLLMRQNSESLAALLLHTGETIEWLAPDVLAAPWWTVA